MEGPQMYPQDEYIKANESGFPTSQRREWLSRDQLKAYMSKPTPIDYIPKFSTVACVLSVSQA
jgi:hypothetical protein